MSMVTGIGKLPGGTTAELLERARARWGYERPPRSVEATSWLGLELVPDRQQRSDGLSAAELDDPQLVVVEQRLRLWPEGVESMQLLDHFTPLRSGRPGRGCTSGHHPPEHAGDRLGVFVTIDDATGCAEGIVHELGHQKLHCLGIDIESHDMRMFKNGDEALWFSPIRRDCPRPFAALLHGVYAYAHVLEVDLRAPDGLPYLQVNVPKVRRGLHEVAKAAEPTAEGRPFLDALFYWGDTVVDAGARKLRKNGLPELRWDYVEWAE